MGAPNDKAVADCLGVSRNKAYELLNKGEIQSLTVGRTRRVSAVALAKFITRPNENAFDTDPQSLRMPRWAASSTKTTTPPPMPASPRTPAPTERRRSTPLETIDLS